MPLILFTDGGYADYRSGFSQTKPVQVPGAASYVVYRLHSIID